MDSNDIPAGTGSPGHVFEFGGHGGFGCTTAQDRSRGRKSLGGQLDGVAQQLNLIGILQRAQLFHRARKADDFDSLAQCLCKNIN